MTQSRRGGVRRWQARRSQRGSGPIGVLWLSLLLLVPLVWVLLSVFAVQRGSFGFSAVSRAAERAYALAPDDRSAQRRAEAVDRQALADQGLASALLRVDVTCTPLPSDCHSATSATTVAISSAVRLPRIPDVFGAGATTFALQAQQSVPIGRFRENTGRG